MNVQIPSGWRWASPDELSASERHALGIGPFGSDLKVSDYTDHGVPLVFVRNIRAEVFLPAGQPHISMQKAALLAAHRVRPGDVLITKMGEPPGDAALYPEHAPEGRMTADCIRLRVDPRVAVPKFVMYATRARVVRRQIIEATRGVAQKKISLERFRTIRYPLPAIDVQRQIVDLIDTHFSRLDAAVASLTRAKANLKRARASVLKAAVEGRLVPTEAALARAEGREYEPASVLLARILAERKAAWAASGARGKYAEPVAPETEALPKLPEGWCWARMDAVAQVVGGITKDAKQTDGRLVPYLRVANVQRGRLDLSEIKSIFATEQKIEALRLQPGDVLLNEGGDRDKLGRGWVWRGEIPECIHQNHVFRARLWTPVFDSRYLSHYANTEGDRYFLKEGKQTTNLASISLSKVKALPVALPPAREIGRILGEVDRRLSVLDALDASVDASLSRCARLRQSILERAFEGRLVPAAAGGHAPLLAADQDILRFGRVE